MSHDIPCWREVTDRAPKIKGRAYAVAAELVRKWFDSETNYGIEAVRIDEEGINVRGTNTRALAAMLAASAFQHPVHLGSWYAEVVAWGARVPVFIYDTAHGGGDVA